MKRTDGKFLSFFAAIAPLYLQTSCGRLATPLRLLTLDFSCWTAKWAILKALRSKAFKIALSFNVKNGNKNPEISDPFSKPLVVQSNHRHPEHLDDHYQGLFSRSVRILIKNFATQIPAQRSVRGCLVNSYQE